MKQILIPIDFSENSKNAIRYAVDLFMESPSHFFLLFVNMEGSNYIKKPVYNFGTNILIESEPISIAQKLEDLKKYAQSISSKNEGNHFSTLLEDGYFLESIRKQILTNNIELTVMGTKGASEMKEFLVGTRAGDVISKVECDVLIVPDKCVYKGFKEVVFSSDLATFYSTDTINTISKIVTSETTKIRVLHVTKSSIPLTGELQVQKKKLMKLLFKELPNPISFHSLASKNVENAIQIFAQSFNVELIIMVSKDYNMLQKLFLDTTVEEVSFETQIPILSLQG